MSNERTASVLIVGAGPVGLTLAMDLAWRGVDVVVSGVPFDTATSNRPGARFGPRAIRAASVQQACVEQQHRRPACFDRRRCDHAHELLRVSEHHGFFADPHRRASTQRAIASIDPTGTGAASKPADTISTKGRPFARP